MGLVLFLVLMLLFFWWGRERRAFLRAPQPVRLGALARAVKGAVDGRRITGQFAGHDVRAGLLLPTGSQSAAAQEEAGMHWQTVIQMPECAPFRLHWAIDPAVGRRAPLLTGPDPVSLEHLLRWAELEPLLADGETILVGEEGRLCLLERLPGDGLPTPERLLAHLDLLDRAAETLRSA
ncbi:MAG TPA: hypothetical protein VK191_17530 [Symbiobacteriaceae bacterium]|nr:hypothetical protein [Symbiobacteriaceae bacterium]